MVTKTTQGIRIDVKTKYLAEQSDPSQDRYFFAYQIRITNLNSGGVRLISRHWLISNSEGRVEEVRGEGVVGQQPHLGPAESFEYTSYCPLNTPLGSMRGSYQMIKDDGEGFDAEVPEFDLVEPTHIVLH